LKKGKEKLRSDYAILKEKFTKIEKEIDNMKKENGDLTKHIKVMK
jgi:ribosomal protein S15P/S13E